MELNNITFRYGEKVIFENFSFHTDDSVICIMSPSGIGKTTLLHMLANLKAPQKGEVKNPFKRPAILFQEDRLLPWFNVRRNLEIVSKDRKRIEELLEEIGIDGNQNIEELSGGMKRRVALARALLIDSDALLLDEPFNGMDEELMRKMAKLILAQKKPTVVSTHSEKEAEALGAKIIRL
ncbi:MAG: ATP-binding cassette domain-containing protein [Erysipelotrichaceae bacterium]|nr:ATP-binding cassette domain-containing protein [Erysipelotrichaceae bacterium]